MKSLISSRRKMEPNNRTKCSNFQILCFFVVIISTISVTWAQDNAWIYFGNCQYTSCESIGKASAECCAFTDNNVLDTFFCVTEQQKDGQYRGNYTDDELTTWHWTCQQPQEQAGPEDEEPAEENTGGQESETGSSKSRDQVKASWRAYLEHKYSSKG